MAVIGPAPGLVGRHEIAQPFARLDENGVLIGAVIAFSVSGFARSVVEAVLVARQYGAQTVAITPAGSDLAKAADVLIPYQANEDGNIYKPTSSRFALLAILDMIATATAEARGPKVLESLRRIKHSLNTLTIDDPRLPLGD